MSAPGVVVVHDRNGLHPHVHDLAEELTMAGFAVEVVDLYGGSRTTDAARAEELADALSGTEAVATIAAAVARLRDGGSAVVGAIGFSLGGNLALHAAREGTVERRRGVRRLAQPGRRRPDHLPGAAAPVRARRPGTAEDVAAYVAALEAAGTPVDTFTYPGTGHSFANPDVPSGDAAPQMSPAPARSGSCTHGSPGDRRLGARPVAGDGPAGGAVRRRR